MNENVIERLIEKWRPSKNRGCFVAAAHQRCADELQAATHPEQFVPRLDDWPEWAMHIVTLGANPNGKVRMAYTYDDGELNDIIIHEVQVDIPPGIDPRIKVSRSDMKRWEAER